MNDLVKVWLVSGGTTVVTHKEFLQLEATGKVRYYEVVTTDDITIDSEL